MILVDDGSTDDTADIAAQFPDVRYIHQDNHGLSHARNTGAAAAKGEVFAYTDSDCMADVDWLYYLIATAPERRLCGRGRPKCHATGRKLGSGLCRSGAGRSQPRSTHRHDRRTHSRL